jgi:hypothetical protein
VAHHAAVCEAQFDVLHGHVEDSKAHPHPMGVPGSLVHVQGERVTRNQKRRGLLHDMLAVLFAHDVQGFFS